MHVLEHVGSPRAFVLDALRYLQPGGTLYIEVPLELTEQWKDQFVKRDIDAIYKIHEHMNKFELGAIQKLVESIPDLMLVDCAEDKIDGGLAKYEVGHLLVHKR